MWRYARHSLYRCKTKGQINIRCTARAFLERRADRIISSSKCAQVKKSRPALYHVHWLGV